MSLNPDSQRRLRAAEGFLELGMPHDAIAELEEIEAIERHLPPVLAVRLEAYRTLRKWELVETVARRLTRCEPHVPRWWTHLARATTNLGNAEKALTHLKEAGTHHPDCAEILYEQAYGSFVAGEVLDARNFLQRAFELDPDLRLHALDDNDLQSVWVPF